MYCSSGLFYKALHILKAQYLIFNLYLSFLLANFDNVIADPRSIQHSLLSNKLLSPISGN